MKNTEIIQFLKDNIEPLEREFEGKLYRCSAHLKDGTYLPCVVFQNPEPTVNRAIKRLKEERTGKSIFAKSSGVDGYRDMVKLYTTGGNKVNEYDIVRVEISPFAFPKNILSAIRGETTMSWTGFGVKMKDGKEFGFGTSFLFEFFQMPDGYVANDIDEILNHRYMSISGELKEHKVPFMEWPNDYDEKAIYRERQYFKCYLEGI
nr:hypothetical protein [uncultured Allomuricauda sp.]